VASEDQEKECPEEGCGNARGVGFQPLTSTNPQDSTETARWKARQHKEPENGDCLMGDKGGKKDKQKAKQQKKHKQDTKDKKKKDKQPKSFS
jgi:hypothetical protein